MRKDGWPLGPGEAVPTAPSQQIPPKPLHAGRSPGPWPLPLTPLGTSGGRPHGSTSGQKAVPGKRSEAKEEGQEGWPCSRHLGHTLQLRQCELLSQPLGPIPPSSWQAGQTTRAGPGRRGTSNHVSSGWKGLIWLDLLGEREGSERGVLLGGAIKPDSRRSPSIYTSIGQSWQDTLWTCSTSHLGHEVDRLEAQGLRGRRALPPYPS